MPGSAPVFIVMCTRRKQNQASRAEDLYTSPLFQAAKSFVKAQAGDWAIASAKHGFLRPDSMVEPYDKALDSLQQPERQQWAHAFVSDFIECFGERNQVILLTDQTYSDALVPALHAAGIQASCPLQNLTLTEATSWLQQRRNGVRPEEAASLSEAGLDHHRSGAP